MQVGVRDLSNAESAMIDASGGRIATFFDSDLAYPKWAGPRPDPSTLATDKERAQFDFAKAIRERAVRFLNEA